MDRRTIVIPCAGEGLRMGGGYAPIKCLLRLNGRTVLDWVVSYWKPWAKDFVIIGPRQFRPLCEELERIGAHARVVVQGRPDGIGNAVGLAEGETTDSFIVVLGDCLVDGTFETVPFPVRGFGVWRGSDTKSIRSNYGVRLRYRRIVQVREKPRHAAGYHCGMGVYFLDGAIFDLIRAMRSREGERLGITAVLAGALRGHYGLNPVFFRGVYINVNTPSDFERARDLFPGK